MKDVVEEAAKQERKKAPESNGQGEGGGGEWEGEEGG